MTLTQACQYTHTQTTTHGVKVDMLIDHVGLQSGFLFVYRLLVSIQMVKKTFHTVSVTAQVCKV